MMQFLKYFFLTVFLTGLVCLMACNNQVEPELTDAQKISKVWRIQNAVYDGSNPVTFNTESFRITFQSSPDGAPTTFSVTPGQVPDGAKPNFNGNANSGTWEISSDNMTITFIEGAIESTVNYSNLSENNLTLSWDVPESLDKLTPTYTYELVPQ